MRPTHNTATTDSTGHTTMENIKEAVVDNVENLKTKAVEGLEKASHVAHEVWDKAADTTFNDVHHSFKKYVAQKPVSTLLVAAGAGLVLGMLIRGIR